MSNLHKVYLRGGSHPLFFRDNRQYMVEVRGCLFGKCVDSGVYRIKISSYGSLGMATFYKPKGTAPIVTDFLDNLMFMTADWQANGTILLGNYEGTLR